MNKTVRGCTRAVIYKVYRRCLLEYEAKTPLTDLVTFFKEPQTYWEAARHAFQEVLVEEFVPIIVAALVAVCGAAKLDRTYLPPASAKTAGGSPGAIQAPNSFTQSAAPKGSYTNDFQGVVVDAALAGTRASGPEETGLGGPRNSYGSSASKVGDAAFRGAQAGFRFPVSSQDEFETNPQFGASIESEGTQFAATRGSQNFVESRDSAPENSQTFGVSRETPASSQVFEPRESIPERPQAAQERAASILRFDSEVGAESFNYAFETDNGISAEESGIATNGVQAQGGFSYTGDDGKVYSVTYTADEGGYQPRGDHLPTPPPIPEEILKSLEQNARDEANGVIDDGFYDAQKYNEGGDYEGSDSGNGKQNSRPSVTAVTGNADVDASGSFINQNNLPFNSNNQRQDDKTQGNRFQPSSTANGNFQGNSASGNRFGSRNEYLPPVNNQNKPQKTRPKMPTANAQFPLSSDTDSSSTFQLESTENGSGDFESNPHQVQPHSDSFADRPTGNRFNAFQQSSSNRNQFNQNSNRFPSSQGNRQQFTEAFISAPANNGQQQFSAQPGSPSLSSQQATSIPDTELTTPFESSPQQSNAQPSAPTATNPFGFNRQPSRPAQSQFGLQNGQQEASQAPAQPTIPSFAQSRPQNINNRPQGANRNTQSVFSSHAPKIEEQFNQQPQYSNKRPQSQQSQFPQNSDKQFSPSTQKSQFSPQSNAQDDSYYHNHPPRAFNTPPTQGSRFPSSPSNQFNRVTQRPSFSSQVTEEENYPSTAFPTQNGQRGSTKYPRPPTLPAETTPSNNQYQSNAITSAANGITQASVSSFAAPTSSTGFNRQPFGQSRQQLQQQSFQSSRVSSSEANKPFAAQMTPKPQPNRGQSLFEQQNFEAAKPLSQQPLQDVKQPNLDTVETQSVTNQQYKGEIYEYTKPAETLPPPESGFGQFGTKVQSSQPMQSRSKVSQTSTVEAQKPTPRPSFGSFNGFGQSSTASQEGQFQSQPQFGESSNIKPERPTPTPFGSKPMRFGKSTKVSQNDQFSAQTSPQEQATNDQFSAKAQFGNQAQIQSLEQPGNNQFDGQKRPFGSQPQGTFVSSTAEVSRPLGSQNGRPSCCNAFGQKQTFEQVNAPSQFGGENQFESQSAFQGSPGLRPESKSVAGKGEVFGGPRTAPSFDESGYHY